MTDRWALAPAGEGGVDIAPLGPDGLPAGPVEREPDPVTAVRSRPQVTRWVWRTTAEVYPRLLATGVHVERCYDIEVAETLLLGHEGRLGEPRSAAAALARLHGTPVPPDPPQRSAEPATQSSLFEPRLVHVPLTDLIEVYADQQRRHFVVQGSAADWALLLLAALRRALAGMAAELVFFQHDEVIVHCPAEEADAVVAAIGEASEIAGRLTFGQTPVRFPFTTAVVECYADAK